MDVKEAVDVATKYLRSLYPQAANIRLEEVESTDSRWLITLSFVHLDDALSDQIGRISWGGSQRDYKEFTVDAESGAVRAMKIRKVS